VTPFSRQNVRFLYSFYYPHYGWSTQVFYGKSKEETLNLLETYLEHTPTDLEKKIVYAYMALGGFAWTLWAVYKFSLGETFGEYTLIMYRYAKDYYNEVMNID